MAKAKFIGVYASTRVPAVRTQPSGQPKKRYWFAWEDGWGRFRVQLLDGAFQPLDTPRVVPSSEFTKYFEHQPHILVTPVMQVDELPADEAPQLTTTEAVETPLNLETSFETGLQSLRTSRAEEQEIEKAAELDRQCRKEFESALSRWENGDKIAPLKTFENMYKRKEGIIPAHKHMFTDFAINLRKSSLMALATCHYQRAAELAPEDGHAHFNLARIYYETGRLEKAEEQLHIALELVPDFTFANRLLHHIQGQRDVLRRESKRYGAGFPGK